MSKVILVNPALSTMGYSVITPRWLFVIAKATPRDLAGDPILIDEAIDKFEPGIICRGDIVGIGISTGNCLAGYNILREAKSRGATVIMGGIHPTIFPEEPLEMGADAVVTGNGDLVWRKVINDALNHALQRRYVGGRVPGDSLLRARWDLLDPKHYMFPTVQTVAGCPENCSFCSVWVTDGRQPRQRLTSKIIEEVNELYDLGFRYIVFADDNFNLATLGRIAREPSPQKRKELEQIREERLRFFDEYDRSVPQNLFAFTQMTVEVTSDDEYLSAMYEKMRIRAALIGVESFSEEGLRSANKLWNPTGQKMVETIQKIQDAGILVLSSIICGLESDTVQTIRTRRKFALESGSILAQFTFYHPYPGTKDFYEMMSDAKNRGKPNVMPKHKTRIPEQRFWLKGLNEVDLIRHANISREDLLAENKKVLGCLLFCRRGCQTRATGQTGNVVSSRQVYLSVVLYGLPTNLWRTRHGGRRGSKKELEFFHQNNRQGRNCYLQPFFPQGKGQRGPAVGTLSERGLHVGPRERIARQVGVIAGLLLACAGLFAQDQPRDSVASAAQQQERCGLKKLDQCLKDLAHDQAGIWTSPLRVNSHDTIWLVPFAGATGAAFAYDQDALRQVGITNKSLVNRSETISEFGSPYATFGEAGALYVLGALKHNDHLRETGILGAEAVANASLVAEGLKLATNRERPNDGLGTGRFWPQGTRNYSFDSSFPSGHAAASWALARVIAEEYPGWWTKLGAYSFATAISASRITGRQHFPSDVLVGSTFGYLIGGFVVRHHSSADQGKTTYALVPTFDRAQHAYGITLILSRNTRQVEESDQAVKDLSSPASWSNQEPKTKPQTEGVPPASPSASPSQGDSEGKQSKRILWVIPNYRAVSANTQLPLLLVKNKFWLATQDSFDYSSFILAGALAGIGQARNSTPEFRQGAAGYGRYYWHSFADQALGNYLTEAIAPAATREDPRYYTLGHGGFFRRTGYAASRLFITKTDSGGRSFNFSEIVGNGAGAGISDLYYPAPERTWTKTQQKWLTQLAIDGIFNVFKEFWPDINRTVFRGHY